MSAEDCGPCLCPLLTQHSVLSTQHCLCLWEAWADAEPAPGDIHLLCPWSGGGRGVANLHTSDQIPMKLGRHDTGLDKVLSEGRMHGTMP